MSGRMKLVAGLIVAPIEVDRYLMPCVDHLLEFCDEVAIVADSNGTSFADDALRGRWDKRVKLTALPRGLTFYNHEGQARQALLDFTLTTHPTHVLAIDSDEFVTDGKALRRAIEKTPVLHDQCWTMCMMEVWEADTEGLRIRQDGGWREHDVVTVWRPDKIPSNLLTIPQKALASGRVPEGVRRMQRRQSCVGIMHFGWANVPERQRRYDRYVKHDGGKFHASNHLQSIMWRDSRVALTGMEWPDGLAPWKKRILDHAGVKA